MLAAGVSWGLLIANAQWAARYGHTSVIDAAGAIYVIGGYRSNTTISNAGYFQDVVVSTDGGARTGLSRGWSGGTTGRSTGVLQGVLQGVLGVLRGTSRLRQRDFRGT